MKDFISRIRHLCRRAAVLPMLAVLMTVLLAGCAESASGPTKDDAGAYVKAVLDLMCLGEYDQSVNLADVERGKEKETRDAMIDSVLSSIVAETSMNEEQAVQLREYLAKAFTACRYSIKNVTSTEENEYDVTVSIEPLRIFRGVSEAIEAKTEELKEDPEDLISISEEEKVTILYDTLIEKLNENLNDPQYAEAEEVVVHYGLIDEENNLYGIDEDAGALLGKKLFSAEDS